MEQTFIHLHVHSAYSLAEGAIKVKDLVKACLKSEMAAVAVTDSNNMFGALEFATEAAKAGVQPIIGAQVQMAEGGGLVFLVQTEEGYRNLCRLVTAAHMNGAGDKEPAATIEDLQRYGTGLICLTGGAKGPMAQLLRARQPDKAKDYLLQLKEVFGDRVYLELQRHHTDDESQIEPVLIDLAYAHGVPIVATNDCYFLDPEMHEAHDALLCIAGGRYINEDDRRRETPEHYLKSPDEMVALFEDLPEAIENTVIIAQRCSYLLKSINPLLPKFGSGDLNEIEELEKQAREGLQWRLENYVYTAKTTAEKKAELEKIYLDRMAYEIKTIVQMGFPGYFLIVSDFIKWAKDHNIPVGPGRGSGAGSVVAWALKITDLNPLDYNLLFERFLNPERVSMPDFDVDFCQDRRDEVIHYVQSRYGRDRVAQIITFGKLQARAVVRDVGRVLQMPYGQVDRIAKMIPQNPTNPVSLEEAIEKDPELQAVRDSDESIGKLIAIALQLEGLYRHASTHAAGVVIGDRDLVELLPLYRDPRSDMPVTQFNMKYVESAGLVKFDFLGLKTLTVIQKALEYIKADHQIDIDILKIPMDDAPTFELLSSGETAGVFQVESAGMRDAIRKLKPNRFEDIIALVALYRPGPMENIPRYIAIKEGKEEPDYLHPKLEPILKETYGIMVYQEQVIQAAQVLCGYTAGGADLLRRAMGKKIKAEMDAQREKFVKGAIEISGLNEDYANTIFDLIAKFADYGFNKSHAAAYALICYQTAWLKAHYPVEFMAALMTLDKGNTDKLAFFKQAVDSMGIKLLPPDINKSLADFRVEGDAIRYALAALKGVGDQAMRLICAERDKNGAFASLADFLKRIDPHWINRRQIEVLAAAGAFDRLNPERLHLYAGADHLLAFSQRAHEEKETGQSSLFGGEESSSSDSEIALPAVRWDPLEVLQHEFEAVGFYLSAHPLDSRGEQLKRLGIVSYARIPEMLESKPVARVHMAGVLIRKNEKISKSGNKFAFLQLSDTSGVYEATVFSEALSRGRQYLEPGTSLLLSADAEMQDETLRLTVQDIRPLDETLMTRVQEVALYLADGRGLPQLKDILAEEKRGAVKMKVFLTVQGHQVTLKLPESYAYQAATRDRLYRVDGLKQLNES